VKRCWEIIGDNLSKAGWSWGCVATVDREGRTIFVADAHRDDGRRFVVHADERLTALLELERAICIHLLSEQIKSRQRFRSSNPRFARHRRAQLVTKQVLTMQFAPRGSQAE
jgi:hypothetical protein